ncbi:MAG: hypothetical protein ACR2PZ_25445 [Pseudomonadales bacterium]
MRTIVYQSHKTPLHPSWIHQCTASVREWATTQRFDYQLLGDELFDLLPRTLFAKVAQQRTIAADLARLRLLQRGLQQSYERVIWIDADVLILQTASWKVGDSSHGFGREVWVQETAQGLKTYRKIHNAVMLFCQQDPVLEFYRLAAERVVERHRAGPLAPQIVGPKLLTALHNLVGFDVIEDAGMLPPLVAQGLLQGGGSALQAFNVASTMAPKALNLCSSLLDEQHQLGIDMHAVIASLLDPDQMPLLKLPGISQT